MPRVADTRFAETIAFKTSYETVRALVERAKNDGVNTSEVIRQAIAAYLDEERELTAWEQYCRVAYKKAGHK